MPAYYNEFDPYAAQWLRNLIAAGHIAPGDVDERSITEVQPDDLKGYIQCHFFAGIGGWSLALRLAEWPDDRPVWTGSCPCQPLSSAGQRKGHADERHLWPAFHGLISECKPPVVFGEQVASADGREWFAAVRADLETVGYACGAADLCAAGVGAPHIRQRLWWVADASSARLLSSPLRSIRGGEESARPRDAEPERLCGAGGVADANCERCDRQPIRLRGRKSQQTSAEVTRSGADGRLADAGSGGSASWLPEQEQRQEGLAGKHDDSCRKLPWRQTTLATAQSSPPDGRWRSADWLYCRDGKWRPVEPGTFPLANGISGRVGRLRAYGNAIVPQVGAAFINAYSAPLTEQAS